MHDDIVSNMNVLRQQLIAALRTRVVQRDHVDVDILTRILNTTSSIADVLQHTTTKACLAGKYRDPNTIHACLDCEVGEYQDEPGQSDCKDCATALTRGLTSCPP